DVPSGETENRGTLFCPGKNPPDGGAISKRTTGAATLFCKKMAGSRRESNPRTLASAQGSVRRHHGTNVEIGASASDVAPLRRSSIWTRASPIACSRCFGSLFKHHRSERRSFRGVAADSKFQSGSVLSTEAKVVEISSPSKARRPVNISNRTHPNA